MAYRREPLEKYVDDAASGQPTPGGGSVSALAGALGASMACMAANFTVGKKKFEPVWPQVQKLLAACERARADLLAAMDEDVAAYTTVSAAYAMPKDTDADKAARSAAIQQALGLAMETPMKAFITCAGLIGALDELAELANPNLISDVGVAAALALGSLEGLRLNVEVNLALLKDERLAADARSKLEQFDALARKGARKVLDKVYGRIRQ